MTIEAQHVHDWRHGPLVSFDLTPRGDHTVDAVCVSCWDRTKLPWPTSAPAWTDADYTEHAEEVEQRFGPTLDATLLREITDSAHRVWPKHPGS